jgi:hypothetical protein
MKNKLILMVGIVFVSISSASFASGVITEESDQIKIEEEMKAVKFDGHNVVIAEHQEEYQSLPAYVSRNSPEVPMTFCFELDDAEKAQVIETGHIWLTVMTFGKNLQPIGMSVLNPIEQERLRRGDSEMTKNNKLFKFSYGDEDTFDIIVATTLHGAAKYASEDLDRELMSVTITEVPEILWDMKMVYDPEDWADPDGENYNPTGRDENGYKIMGSYRDLAKGLTSPHIIATSEV